MQSQPQAAASPQSAVAHPCTLLGAARALLQPAGNAQERHLQAEAACLLGDHARAQRLWTLLARDGDVQAQARLAQWEMRWNGSSGRQPCAAEGNELRPPTGGEP